MGVLVALLLPAIQAARASARLASCQSNLHQLGVALQSYHALHNSFPPGGIDRRKRSLAWTIHLLPQLEERRLFEQIDRGRSYFSAENRRPASRVIPVFLCPATARLQWDREANRAALQSADQDPATNPPAAMIDYGGVFGTGLRTPLNNGVMIWDQPIALRQVVDGSTHTLIVGEDSGRGPAMNGEWINAENMFDVTVPINSQQDNELWSDHTGGAGALACDGHVRFLDQATALEVIAALCTRAGHEVVSIW